MRKLVFILLVGLLALPQAGKAGGWPIAADEHPALIGGPGFTLNPNPVTGSYFFINLEFSEAEFPQAKVTITNVLGQAVYVAPIRKTEFATGKIRIELADAKLDKGVYFVQVSSGDNTKTLKLAVR